MITITHYLVLSAILFTLGVVGVLVRRNAIIIFMCIELMLNAVNLSFVAFAHYLSSMQGQLFVFFTMTVAAAEAAVGLAIIVAVFRNKETVNKMADVFLHYAKMQSAVEMTRVVEYRHPTGGRQPTDVLWRYAPVIIAVLADMRTMQASTISAGTLASGARPFSFMSALRCSDVIAIARRRPAAFCGIPIEKSVFTTITRPPMASLIAAVVATYETSRKSILARRLSVAPVTTPTRSERPYFKPTTCR